MLCEPQLHAAVLADPDDDAPRLVYADWLAARGDPRGEWIAVQIARARSGAPASLELVARERALLAEHGDTWRAPFKGAHVEHVRGFVEAVRGSSSHRLTADAVANACVRLLRISDRKHDVCAPLRALLPAMRLRELHLDTGQLALAPFTELVDALDGLRTLGLPGPALEDGHVEAMLAARGLAAVDALHVGGCRLARLERLARWPRPLRELAIRYAGARGFAKLVDAPAYASLEVLDLCRSGIAKADLRAILDSSMPLVALDLMQCELDADDARAIAATPRLAALQRLNVAHTRIGVAGLEALCDSPYLSRELVLAIDGDVLGLRPDYWFDDQGRAYGGGWEGTIDERWTSRFRIVLDGSSM